MNLSESKEYLDTAQRLLDCVQKGDTAQIEGIIDELTHIRETQLFRELGMLTRELHDSLKAFRMDTRITELTQQEIPDARERLNYVITMTEQAAHRTLSAIEASMPAVETLNNEARTLKEQWGRFRSRKMTVDEFREMSKHIDGFLAVVEEHAGKLQGNLTDALMAQDFQDLTGQVIRRVINLVQEVEENLVQIVRISGQRIVGEEKREGAAKKKDALTQGEGPRVPETKGDDAEFVSGQDDVDDLLSSLGF